MSHCWYCLLAAAKDDSNVIVKDERRWYGPGFVTHHHAPALRVPEPPVCCAARHPEAGWVGCALALGHDGGHEAMAPGSETITWETLQ